MKNVLEQAQKLAEAILDSEIYQRMHKAEMQADTDPEAVKAVTTFMEKRQAVENLLTEPNADKDALAAAGRELEEAEQALNEVPLVKEMQEARGEFTEMMNNVNRLLSLIITGKSGDEGGCGSCSGSCEGCSGCH